jgi:hypothetical protein
VKITGTVATNSTFVWSLLPSRKRRRVDRLALLARLVCEDASLCLAAVKNMAEEGRHGLCFPSRKPASGLAGLGCGRGWTGGDAAGEDDEIGRGAGR